MAAIVAMLVIGGVYALRGYAPDVVTLPAVPPADMTRSFSKSEPRHLPSPMPKTAAVPEPKEKSVATGYLRPGIYRCADAQGAVTYGDIPCGEGKLVDTKPTSAGFAEKWSITVKQR